MTDDDILIAIKFAYQDAREYVRLVHQKRGTLDERHRAYGTFRDSCKRAFLDYRQVLIEVRRENARFSFAHRLMNPIV